MGKSHVRECKTGSTGKPAVKSLNKRNYLTRVYARVLAASAGESEPCTNIHNVEEASSVCEQCKVFVFANHAQEIDV